MALERTVVEWMVTFHNDTPELRDFDRFFDMLIKSFQDGLNDDVYNTCISRGVMRTQHGWYVLAEEVEIDLV